MAKPKIYLASPYGFTAMQRHGMYELLVPAIKETGCIILDPWAINKPLADQALALPPGPEQTAKWAEVNLNMGENNEEAMRECDGLVACLDGPDPDSGTSSEVGFVYGLGKPIIGYRDDFRMAGENPASIINLQPEHFIRKSIPVYDGKIVTSIPDLQKEIRRIFFGE